MPLPSFLFSLCNRRPNPGPRYPSLSLLASSFLYPSPIRLLPPNLNTVSTPISTPVYAFSKSPFRSLIISRTHIIFFEILSGETCTRTCTYIGKVLLFTGCLTGLKFNMIRSFPMLPPRLILLTIHSVIYLPIRALCFLLIPLNALVSTS